MVMKIYEKYHKVYIHNDGDKRIIEKVQYKPFKFELKQQLLCEFLSKITYSEANIIKKYSEEIGVNSETLIASIRSQRDSIKKIEKLQDKNKELKEKIKCLNKKLEEISLEYKEKIKTYEMLKIIINKMTNEE